MGLAHLMTGSQLWFRLKRTASLKKTISSMDMEVLCEAQPNLQLPVLLQTLHHKTIEAVSEQANPL